MKNDENYSEKSLGKKNKDYHNTKNFAKENVEK